MKLSVTKHGLKDNKTQERKVQSKKQESIPRLFFLYIVGYVTTLHENTVKSRGIGKHTTPETRQTNRMQTKGEQQEKIIIGYNKYSYSGSIQRSQLGLRAGCK